MLVEKVVIVTDCIYFPAIGFAKFHKENESKTNKLVEDIFVQLSKFLIFSLFSADGLANSLFFKQTRNLKKSNSSPVYGNTETKDTDKLHVSLSGGRIVFFSTVCIIM